MRKKSGALGFFEIIRRTCQRADVRLSRRALGMVSDKRWGQGMVAGPTITEGKGQGAGDEGLDKGEYAVGGEGMAKEACGGSWFIGVA